MTAVMPERQPGDTDVTVTRLDNGYLRVSYGGDSQDPYVCSGSLVVSPYNAWRVFGLLACMLGISLPRSLGKAIKL